MFGAFILEIWDKLLTKNTNETDQAIITKSLTRYFQKNEHAVPNKKL